MPHTLRLHLVNEPLAVCRLPAGSPTPAWAVGGDLFVVARTPDELSLVCPVSAVPHGVRWEQPWRALKVEGPLDFGLTGVLASIATPLAAEGVSIFVISTYDTDYVLVRAEQLRAAAAALEAAGHDLIGLRQDLA